MLNYIWAGLIVTSFLFALGYDVRDIAGDRYRNGRPLPVALAFTEVYDSAARRVPVEIRIDQRQYATFYGTEEKPAAELYRLPGADPGGERSSASRPAPNFPSRWPRSPRSPSRATRSCRAAWTASRPPPASAKRSSRHGCGRLRAGPVRQAQRHRRRGARLRQDRRGDRARPGRRAVPLPGPAQDRRGCGDRATRW